MRAHIAEKGDNDQIFWGKCKRIKVVDVQTCLTSRSFKGL